MCDHERTIVRVHFDKGQEHCKADFFLAPYALTHKGIPTCVPFVLQQRFRPSWKTNGSVRPQVSGTLSQKASQPRSSPPPLTTRETDSDWEVMMRCSLVVFKGLLCAPLFDKILGTSHTRVCALMRPTCNCLSVNTHLIRVAEWSNKRISWWHPLRIYDPIYIMISF